MQDSVGNMGKLQESSPSRISAMAYPTEYSYSRNPNLQCPNICQMFIWLASSSARNKMAFSSMAAPQTVIRVFLLGCGGVGNQLISHILATRALHASQKVRIAVVGMCDQCAIAICKQSPELSDEALLNIHSAKAAKAPLSSLQRSDLLEIHEYSKVLTIEDLLHHIDITNGLVLVDCTASDKLGQLLGQASEKGCCVVLANKKPLTGSLEIYDKITLSKRHFRCESTVGAGLPVMTSLTRILSSGDCVHQILGMLSGTLGYLMTELEKGKPYSEIVQNAKSLGYTEPDPRDDLSGMDVARKALIMARHVGWRISMEDIEIESLYPTEMGSNKMSVEEFMNGGLQSLDAKMKFRIEDAASRGCVLRYLATVEEHSCKVGLREKPRQSAMGQLHGSDNMIEIYSRCYSISPLQIKGAGAGNDTTAAGVLADVIDLQDLF